MGATLLVSRVGDELSALRSRAGLSRRDLAELAGISDGAIKLIEYGRTEQPEPATLRRIAEGLATNRAMSRVDADAARDLYAVLMQAAGYSPPEVTAGAEGLEEMIRAAGNDARSAAIWAAFIRRYPSMTAGQKKVVAALLDNIPHLGDR